MQVESAKTPPVELVASVAWLSLLSWVGVPWSGEDIGSKLLFCLGWDPLEHLSTECIPL